MERLRKLSLFTDITLKDLFKNLSWTIFGNIVSKLILFVSLVFVARILGKEDYGRFGIIRSTITMFGVFAGFGLGLTTNKHIAEGNLTHERKERILGLSIITGLSTGVVLFIIIFAFSDAISTVQLNDGSLRTGLRIAAVIVLLSALNMVQNGTLSGLFSFKEIARNNILQNVIALPIFLLLSIYYSLNGAILAFAFYYLFGFILNQISLKEKMKIENLFPNYKEGFKEIKVLLLFSLPALLGGLLASPVRWFCESSLTSNTNGYSELGIYNATLAIQSAILLIASALNSPILSQLNKRRTSNVDFININLPTYLFTLMSLPFFYFTKVFRLIFGESFSDPGFSIVLVLVLVSTLFIIFSQGFFRCLASANYVWFGFATNFIWALGTLLFFEFVFPRNILGLLYSYNIAYTISTIFSCIVTLNKRLIDRSVIFNSLNLTIVIVIIVALSVSLLDPSPLLKLVLFSFSYILMIYASKNYYHLILQEH